MSNFTQFYGQPFTATSTFAGGSAVCTQSVPTGQSRILITDISASSDSTATAFIQDNATIVWKDRVPSTSPYVVNLVSPIRISVGSAVTASISGTANTFINISGYIL